VGLEEGDGAGDGGHGQGDGGDDAVELECLLLHLFAPLLRECGLAAVGRRTLIDLPLDCVSCCVLHSFISGLFLVTTVSQETLAEISPDSRLGEMALSLGTHRALVHLPFDRVSCLVLHRVSFSLVLGDCSVSGHSRQKLARDMPTRTHPCAGCPPGPRPSAT
jgi:hypothetical protein